MNTNDSLLKARLEAVLFSSDEPLRFDRLQALFEVETTVLRQALQELMVEYAQENRGVVLQEVAGGFQIRTRAEYAPWILKLNKSRV